MAAEADPPAAKPGWRRFLPYPVEWVTWVSVAVAVLYLRAQGLRVDWHTVEYTLYPLLPVAWQAFLLGAALYLVYALARRQSARAALAHFMRPRWLIDWARLWLASMLMTYAYFWLKVSVPLVHPRL